jgi:hypothetical protein
LYLNGSIGLRRSGRFIFWRFIDDRRTDLGEKNGGVLR